MHKRPKKSWILSSHRDRFMRWQVDYNCSSHINADNADVVSGKITFSVDKSHFPTKKEVWESQNELVRVKLNNSAHNSMFYYPKFIGWYKYNNNCNCVHCREKDLRPFKELIRLRNLYQNSK